MSQGKGKKAVQLSHTDSMGNARMVDVSDKEQTKRIAVAQGKISMKSQTLDAIIQNNCPKGDVLAVARIAAIMAVKNTPQVIPLCHSIAIEGVQIDFTTDINNPSILVTATVTTTGKTGVEMEALTGVSAACLTIYDMCKAIDRQMVISDIMLMKKCGGASGCFERKDEA